MAKKDKKQKKQYGMGPGQSMAMAGNTGLASFKEKDINRVQQEKRAYNDFSGRDRNERASYTDIGQEIGELASKYRRPVKIADGFGAYSDGSGRAYTPNDFNADGSFRSFTASRPTFSQVMGDAGRAFKGYNSINYDNPGQGYSPVSMQRTPGMIEQGILSPLTTMAKAALGATNDLAGKIKPLFSGTVDLFKEGLGTLNDVKQQIFMNPEKYKFMQEDEEIKDLNEKEAELKRIEELNKKIEADRKQFEELLNISVLQDNLETPEIFRDQFTGTGQSYMDTKENFNSRIPPVSDRPTYAATGDTRPPLNTINPESSREGRELFQQDNAYSKIPPVSDLIDQTFPDNVLNTEETSQSAPGITSLGNNFDASNIVTEDDRTSSVEDLINNSKREISPFSFLNPFDNIPTGVALTEALSPDSLNLSDMGLILGDTTVNDLTEQGKQFYDYYTSDDGGMTSEDALKDIKLLQNNKTGSSEYGDLISSNSITDYLNPGNLVDVGQDGTTGKTYGENEFAIFDSVDSGLIALTKDVKKKVGDFDGNVKKIISKYASGDPDVKGYVDFITDIVGPTVEENEIPTLIESIIIKENKPEIADQYLKYLKENSDKIYDGIISSKNNTSKNNTMLAEITQADIDRFKQPMTQMMDYDTYKSINTDSTLTPDEFNQLKARVA